ncbi:MAG: site-2 protease family protein [Candidatus Krumholzibacteria bacterium]|nr:site-2 protease family protein [Candidatus Krumholzibacteria bacterium]
MFGRQFHLFTLYGFSIRIDVSWFFLAVIVTWSLATGVFPFWYESLPSVIYIWMGIAGTVGLFISIVLHELSHSVVARHHGVVMRGITLFIFGGVAEMTDEPPSPRAEFQVAIAGPLASILVSLACLALFSLGNALAWPDALNGVLKYLALINGILVLFNMIPAFPLDGGRVLRALLWERKKSLVEATRITSRIGVGFSYVLIGLGVLSAVRGNLVGGVWYFLIGMFLRGAATMSYQQLMVRQTLEGETVSRFMQTNPITVPPHISISALVEDYVYRYHFKMFPVLDGETLIGCITTREVKSIDRQQWHQRTVRDLAETCGPHNSVAPDVSAIKALSRMSQSGVSRLMVVDSGRLLGVITLKDLLQFLSLKSELEGE